MHDSDGLIQQLRILLVEDDQFLRRVHAHVFKEITHNEVIIAKDGRDAISLLHSHTFDLLVTDIQMPVINGLELIKQIRCGQTPASPALTILVVSTFSNHDVLAACINLEINGFLVKPICGNAAREQILKALKEKPKLEHNDIFQAVDTDLEILKEDPLQEVETPSKRPDPLASLSQGKPRKRIPLTELKPGMVLGAPILAKNGKCILGTGKVLTPNYVNRLMEIHSVIDVSTILVEEN